MSESSESSSSSSESSSSNGCGCFCNIQVGLVPGNTCGIEFTSGIAYAIGNQTVSTIVIDPCHCVDTVYVNNMPNMAYVADGNPIKVSITLQPECSMCEAKPPYCSAVAGMSMMFNIWKKVNRQGRAVLQINKAELVRFIRQRRRRPR
jgi:hypothetical protein